jgi:hypothetical protein
MATSQAWKLALKRAIAAMLAGDSTLSGLLGVTGGVYFHRTPATTPFGSGASSVTYFFVSTINDEYVDSYESIVQIDAWSQDAEKCEQIASRVNELMIRQSLALQAGRVANVLLVNDLGDLYEEDDLLHHRPLQFRVFTYPA